MSITPLDPAMADRPRFALATSDAYQGVLDAFLRAGWQLDRLFVSPRDWMYDNKQVIARALDLGATVQHSPASRLDLAELGRRGCSALVVATYQWKIPDWRDDLKYAVNFHPSPLPEGRGPYPMVRAILEHRSSWAVTCNRIDEKFDQGDILDAEPFPLDPHDGHESLRLKTQMAAARLAERVAHGLEPLWQGAVPQEGGSYWPRWTEQERCIDFAQPVDAIMRRIRACGAPRHGGACARPGLGRRGGRRPRRRYRMELLGSGRDYLEHPALSRIGAAQAAA
ncbi:MAG: hypothetical protein K8F27_00210 [Sulfuricellaceae bacterium]|nr:hypothetical protein [Sulfuricellaceae bacterium]